VGHDQGCSPGSTGRRSTPDQTSSKNTTLCASTVMVAIFFKEPFRILKIKPMARPTPPTYPNPEGKHRHLLRSRSGSFKQSQMLLVDALGMMLSCCKIQYCRTTSCSLVLDHSLIVQAATITLLLNFKTIITPRPRRHDHPEHTTIL
jgi:hypothetical protein